MKSDPFYVVKRPMITEESTIQTHAHNQYVFQVDPRANKHQVRDAIEQMFQVKVLHIYRASFSRTIGQFVHFHTKFTGNSLLTFFR